MIRRSCGLMVLTLLLSGCVQRTLYVDSRPQGAVVTMNGVQLGATPLERQFTYYGTFDVEVRRAGYETLVTRTRVIAPWWQWPPFDFFAEFWPGHFKDKRYLTYTLTPSSTEPVDAEALMDRALTQREQLQSSEFTRAPATTQAATTRSATTQSAAPTSTAPSATAAPSVPASTAPVIQPTARP